MLLLLLLLLRRNAARDHFRSPRPLPLPLLSGPQLLGPAELRPGIAAAEFAERRRLLAAQLPAAGVAVLQAAPQVFMSGVIPYPYRPDADLQYLTGVVQPGAVAVLRADAHLTLFVSDRDAWRETWDGARLSESAAVDCFGAAEAYPLSEMPARLGRVLAAASAVAFDPPSGAAAAAQPRAGGAAGVQWLPAYREAEARGRVAPLRPALHRLRWVKSPAELALLKNSAAAAADAMADCMRATRPGGDEHGVASLFEYRCRQAGARRMAYPPVVASGADATTIHYSRNDKRLQDGDLLLLDGGCELHGYCSDVTRTWPVGGRFSGAQAAVYGAVLGAHRQLLAAVYPGVTLRQLHALSVRLLGEALVDLGVLPAAAAGGGGPANDGAHRPFYPHLVGHWLGMDTHDASTVSHDRPLEPGVVLTIEPGLYIPDSPAYGALRGVGVRLEDDVAVTRGGAEVLSGGVPLEAGEVEAMVGRG